MTCFDFFQQGGKAGTVEIRTRITIVIKMANVSQPFLTDSPACSSSLDRRSYRAVILISSFLATVLTSLLQEIFVCETLLFSILL